jgi:hypothetical protein
MRKTIPYVLGLALIAATIIVGSATATSSPVNLTVQDTGTDATGPFVTLKWTPAPSNVNHIDLYRSDHTVRWDSVPASQSTFTNRDQVVAGTTYGWSLYACSGTAECKTSTASDTVASVLDTVIHGSRGGGGLTDSQVHGIYWQNGTGTGNEIGRTWVYDVSGYGFHFYAGGQSPAMNVLVHNTVVDDSIVRGVLFDGPVGNTYRDSVITDSPYGLVCRNSGNTLTNIRSGAGFQGCTGTGLVTADTVFDNETARNYGNDTSGHFVTGPLY